MDALMFFEPRHRILISGDALWENGMGFVWPDEGYNEHIAAARDALAAIERLAPTVVIPGHGAPFSGVAGSLATARAKLDAFERDPVKNARHIVKVLFVFALLERQSMPVAEVAGYVDRVPGYRLMSERFIGLAPGALADWMLQDLERGGAVKISGGVVRPAMPA
jgi:glyoxylase-like metal-dependent hydrolase (beta-lactamase superfamily II)